MKLNYDYYDFYLEDKGFFQLRNFLVQEEGDQEKLNKMTQGLHWDFTNLQHAYDYFASWKRRKQSQSKYIYNCLIRDCERYFPELFELTNYDLEKKMRERLRKRIKLAKDVCIQKKELYVEEEN